MKMLITGCAGFLGSHLVEALLKRGFEVVGVDNFNTSSPENMLSFLKNKRFRFHKFDVNSVDLLMVFGKEKFDYIFHYAATVGVKRTLENPFAVFRDIEGINNVVRLAKHCRPKKVVFSSSSEVYGEPVQIPESETGPCNAKMPYAVVKLYGESILKELTRVYHIPTVSLRFFNVFGPRQEGSGYGFVTGIFINQVLDGKRPTVFGDGLQTRDFVYIEDNVNAVLTAMMSKKVDGDVINVAGGKPTTITDLAQKIIIACGKSVEPRFVLFPKDREDVRHRWADVEKMHRLLDYKTKVSLENGLKKTVEYYKKCRK